MTTKRYHLQENKLAGFFLFLGNGLIILFIGNVLTSSLDVSFDFRYVEYSTLVLGLIIAEDVLVSALELGNETAGLFNVLGCFSFIFN